MLIAYIKPSDVKNKRYSAIIQDSVSGKSRRPKGHEVKVDFGDKRYQNYTIHQDKDRRERYRLRHKNDHIKDPFSPAFWSWYLLWNKDTLEKSAQDIRKRFNIKVVLS